ncbi:LysR family transcriptional regulator [Undibacter mobilis]|uniref:LysR family transcriptional regulator n=1 Tax=Undibacter mobilis TaxID=2292256 RepID=A0A371B9L3_9BRAD|nr:LysR family transcriptional regulator [Undibacter mobilis]RDV04270.1 LysR family transcriptional regulator [Undibacter mobilis]
MDRLDAMRLYTRIVERRSFTRAAQDTGLPRSTVTDAIKEIEARLGVRLLARTTRHVSPTPEGEAYYRRCLSIIAEVEDAESAFGGITPRGELRIDVHGSMLRRVVVPELPHFLKAYPDLRLHIGEGDRLVDLVREGVDCVIRAGTLRDSTMVARQIAMMEEVTIASPAYLRQYGTPRNLAELEGHRMIGFASSATGNILPLEFMVKGQRELINLPSTIDVTGGETSIALCRLGLGLIQTPRYHVTHDLKAGRLVEVLPKYPPSPTPLSVLYPQSRGLSPRVRVFIDWVAGLFPRGKVHSRIDH